MGAIFNAFGHFIPETTITNKALAERFGITEEWIHQRTGITSRKYFEEGSTSDMIVQAIANSNLTQEQIQSIDCIIVATMTPDYNCPSTAAIVQQKLGIANSFGFDIMAACSGFIYALQLADSLLLTHKYQNILVVGADKMSAVIDPNDRKTSLVLADGAAFCLLGYSPTQTHIIDTICKLDSSLCKSVVIPNGGSAKPLNHQTFAEQEHYLRFTDKKVFDGGIALFENIIPTILQQNKLTLQDIDLIVPHQANRRMLEALAQKLQIPIEKLYINIDDIGNTSAATIPIALSQLQQQHKLQGTILLTSVGAGFTYAASLLKM